MTIIGGGNLGHFSAAIIGSKENFQVNYLTRNPSKFSKEIVAITTGSVWEYKGNIKGKLTQISDSYKEIIEKSDCVLITTPAHTHLEILKKISPFTKPNTVIGTVFGQGAFDVAAHSVFKKRIFSDNLTFFALQNVPSISKVNSYGKSVFVIGPKGVL